MNMVSSLWGGNSTGQTEEKEPYFMVYAHNSGHRKSSNRLPPKPKGKTLSQRKVKTSRRADRKEASAMTNKPWDGFRYVLRAQKGTL